MTARAASCSCGGLSVRTCGEPERISVCHCTSCKRRTGSAFSWNATFAEAQVEIAGDHASFVRTSDDGFWVRHHFCPTCGTRMFYAIERRPGSISVPAGIFGDADFPSPGVEVYGERRCAWLSPLAPLQE